MPRIDHLITSAIQSFNLNLKSFVVLTEAANGIYFVTPIIAALAGARVIAVAKDSIYASAEKAIEYVRAKAIDFKVEDKIDFVSNLSQHEINSADIITNLGFVRPIDVDFVKSIKPTSVISLFCETWEVRKDDINIDACLEREILVMGTNEEAPELRVFEYVGPLILKMIFEAGLEVYQNDFLILSNDKFGKVINNTLNKNDANSKLINLHSRPLIPSDTKKLDAIIVADYTYQGTIIGQDGLISTEELLDRFPDVIIIQFAGVTDIKELESKQIRYFPHHQVGSYRMAKTFDYLGPKPLIDLHSAGLKVGLLGALANRKYKDYNTVVGQIQKHPLCQLLQR
jgi:hypothetical protein